MAAPKCLCKAFWPTRYTIRLCSNKKLYGNRSVSFNQNNWFTRSTYTSKRKEKHSAIDEQPERKCTAHSSKNLDLQGIFENIITEANKPLDTRKHFLDLLQKFDIRPEKGLSIGDNYINDIAPAINIGMQTVYIDLYESDYPEYNGRNVKSISELIKEMNSL